MKSIILFFILSSLVVLWQNSSGQTGNIKGRIFNSISNEAIPFANVIIYGTTTGATSDIDGKFTISGVKAGFYKLTVSSVGFEKKITEEIQVINAKTITVEIPLLETVKQLGAVEVTSTRSNKNEESLVSIQTIGVSEIENNPGSNRDISKVIQSFPGVATTPINRNDVIVRGGSPSESRFYLDDVEIPYLNHFATQGASGGSNGILNADFIREVNFYSGGFPANRGNALSGVFNFTQIDGNKDKIRFRGTVGASELSLTTDGPIGENTNFIFSYRHSYLQFLFKAIGLPFLPTFDDFQMKIRSRINEKTEVTVIGVGSYDVSKIDLNIKNPTENQLYILNFIPDYKQWSYTFGTVFKHYEEHSYHTLVLSRNMLSNASVKYKNNVFEDSLKTMDFSSTEAENKIRYENTSRFENGLKINAGAGIEYSKYTNDFYQKAFRPAIGVFEIKYNSLLEMFKWNIFGQFSKTFFDSRLTSTLGVRTDASNYSSATQNPISQISPRLSFAFLANEKLTINTNTGRYFQLPAYTTLGYRNSAGELVNKNNNIKYIQADHIIAGAEYRPKEDSKITLEGFYKIYNKFPFSLKDSISLANRFADFGTVGDEAVTSTSEGRAYGAELLFQYRFKKDFNLLVSYTYVISEFKDKKGSYIPSSWDSRNIFIVTASKKFKYDISLGAKWRFSGGLPYTPFDIEKSENISAWDLMGKAYLDFNNVNSLRLKPFHQLDLRIDKTFFFTKNTLKLYLDIQNAYNFKSDEPDRITNLDKTGVAQINPSVPTKYLLRTIESEGSGTIIPTIGLIFDF